MKENFQYFIQDLKFRMLHKSNVTKQNSTHVSNYFHTQQSIINVCWACRILGERSEGGREGGSKVRKSKKRSFLLKQDLSCTIFDNHQSKFQVPIKIGKFSLGCHLNHIIVLVIQACSLQFQINMILFQPSFTLRQRTVLECRHQ